MSYSTWHNYGYGICTNDIKDVPAERLQALIHMAPEFEKKVTGWLEECSITEPTVDDYFEFDEDHHGKFATLIQCVIEEVEGIELLYCDDYDGKDYLLFPPIYPWSMTEKEKAMTEDGLLKLFSRYVSVLTDTPITVEYQSAENGG